MSRTWTVVLWVAAVTFFGAAISLFAEGSIGPGVLGIVIAGLIIRRLVNQRKSSAVQSSAAATPSAVQSARRVEPSPVRQVVTPTLRTTPRPTRTVRSVGGIRRVGLTRRRTPHPAREAVYTALDIETTSLDANSGAIVEVGAVKIRGDGTVLDEFATLINSPGSTYEASDVHGIRDSDLDGAPTWPEVWTELAHFMAGTIVVAHNLDFEEKFLAVQARKTGAPLDGLTGLCTLQNARRQLDGRAYSLKSLHRTVSGIWREDEHTALGDARAARDLLLWLLDKAPSPLYLDGPPPVAVDPPEPVILCRTSCRPVPPHRNSVANVVSAFPQSPVERPGDEEAIARYTDLLDECMGDGHLSHAEAQRLMTLGRRTGLTGPQLRSRHEQAWRDAFDVPADIDWYNLDPQRRAQMELAAESLGLADIAQQLKSVMDDLAEPEPSTYANLLHPTRVGIDGCSDELESLRNRATAHGAQIAQRITKTVVWLASNDHAGSTRMLLKARELGIPILTPREARTALDHAVRDAENIIAERERQYREIEELRERYRSDRHAQWRPAWRRKELRTDPGPKRH